MFVINIYLKFALIALGIVGGSIMIATLGFWYGFPFLLMGIILLASYIFLGTIQSAAQMMQNMDFEACEKRLALTLNPKWLYVTNRAYFYLIKGSSAMQRGDQNAAEAWFEKAQNMKLPSDNERAMILMQTISIHIQKQRWAQANVVYRQLKSLKFSKELFGDQFKMIEQAMEQQGKMKGQVGQFDKRMMIRPGGKRKMPRMR